MEKIYNDQGYLSAKQIESIIMKGLEKKDFKAKKLLVVVPDLTRTCPTALIFKTICEKLSSSVKKLDFLIALGTHPPLNDGQIEKLFGMSKKKIKEKYRVVNIYNHDWKKDVIKIGEIEEDIVDDISQGLFKEKIPVTINKKVIDADEVIIVGPVFPHEMVGFSGGYKYFFPGIGGPELIDVFHWLASLITNPKVIGNKNTPPRKLINEAASFVKKDVTSISLVIDGKETCGVFVGNIDDSWNSAVELSMKRNITLKERYFKKVIAIMPELYDELWTAGKGMYKLEPIIEDGGELTIYGPHIDRISDTHGAFIKKMGYHTRDYILANHDKLKKIPNVVKAHCAHVKGIGKYINGIEYPRVKVKLATSIPESLCTSVNLGFIDYNTIDLECYRNREEEGILVVENAGEKLYKHKSGVVPDIDKL